LKEFSIQAEGIKVNRFPSTKVMIPNIGVQSDRRPRAVPGEREKLRLGCGG